MKTRVFVMHVSEGSIEVAREKPDLKWAVLEYKRYDHPTWETRKRINRLVDLYAIRACYTARLTVNIYNRKCKVLS